jgi:phage/plasmid-associated DNA primase
MKSCPNFKKILDYQEFPTEVQMFLCIFMGRTAFKIGDIDNWQAVMFLLGQAGTGKSTILTKILQKWYDECDVGIISNNIEKKYGLKPHAGKFMVIAPEIKDDFCMEQTDWQLICEGGRNTFAEKYKNAESVTWTAHLSMGGNQLPKYKNNSESVSRRTVVWNFWKKVMNSDTQLDKKLDKEIPTIMKLCISGYLWAVNKYGEKGIWSILPKYFHDNKTEMEQTTNSLQNFLSSGKVELTKTVYVPEKVFKQAFNEHCRENNLQKEQFTSDYYSGIFTNNSISIKKGIRKKYPANSDQFVHGTYFIGVDVINNNEQNFMDPDP